MPKALNPVDVRKIRDRLGLSQLKFALRFGFNLSTLRQWEQGRRKPDEAARVLLEVVSYAPEIVEKARAIKS